MTRAIRFYCPRCGNRWRALALKGFFPVAWRLLNRGARFCSQCGTQGVSEK